MSDLMNPADVQRTRRQFVFNGTILADPDPAISIDDVRQHYARAGYPTLTNATTIGPVVQGNKSVYTFTAAVRTKG